jgi:hypothetical protein
MESDPKISENLVGKKQKSNIFFIAMRRFLLDLLKEKFCPYP